MIKLITDTFTFASATSRITGTANNLAVFQPNDPLLVYGGAVLNTGGQFNVLSVDPGGAFLVVDPPPKDETVTCTIRTL